MAAQKYKCEWLGVVSNGDVVNDADKIRSNGVAMRWQCGGCGHAFDREYHHFCERGPEAHSCGSQNKDITCSSCGRSYKDERSLVRHQRESQCGEPAAIDLTVARCTENKRRAGAAGRKEDKRRAGEKGSKEDKQRAGEIGGKRGSKEDKWRAGETGSKEDERHAGEARSKKDKQRAGEIWGKGGSKEDKRRAGETGSKEDKQRAGEIGRLSRVQNYARQKIVGTNLQVVLKNAQFVFTTTSLALHPDHVIVEESSRCTVAMGVACFTRGRAITFVGDSKQLDAFTAINKYLPISDAIHWRQYASKTILDLCRDAFVPVVPIVEQHRMNHSLARMTNDLLCGLMVGHRNDSPHDDSSFLLPNRQMVQVIDTFDYVPNPQSEYHELVRRMRLVRRHPRVETSPYNFNETKAVADLLSEGMLRGWKPHSVVTLANYHEQNRFNSMLFQEHPLVQSATKIGKFQGDQTDVVILTLASSSVGFFDNFKRPYVASPRSRNALVVIGNFKPYLENPRVQYIMKALLASSRGETISHSRHHGLTELPKFTLTPTTWAPQRCLIWTTSMMPNIVL